MCVRGQSYAILFTSRKYVLKVLLQERLKIRFSHARINLLGILVILTLLQLDAELVIQLLTLHSSQLSSTYNLLIASLLTSSS